MPSVFEYMAADHDRLDGIFKQFQQAVRTTDAAAARPLFHDFKIGLQRHIVWEEEILFPIFEERTGMRDNGPTAVMRMEHRQIKQSLDAIHDRIKTGDLTSIPALERELLDVLSAHNEKEEGILYPWIDQSADGPAIEAAFARMAALPPERYAHCCGGH